MLSRREAIQPRQIDAVPYHRMAPQQVSRVSIFIYTMKFHWERAKRGPHSKRMVSFDFFLLGLDELGGQSLASER